MEVTAVLVGFAGVREALQAIDVTKLSAMAGLCGLGR
jgi:hypothetical protein